MGLGVDGVSPSVNLFCLRHGLRRYLNFSPPQPLNLHCCKLRPTGPPLPAGRSETPQTRLPTCTLFARGTKSALTWREPTAPRTSDRALSRSHAICPKSGIGDEVQAGNPSPSAPLPRLSQPPGATANRPTMVFADTLPSTIHEHNPAWWRYLRKLRFLNRGRSSAPVLPIGSPFQRRQLLPTTFGFSRE